MRWLIIGLSCLLHLIRCNSNKLNYEFPAAKATNGGTSAIIYSLSAPFLSNAGGEIRYNISTKGEKIVMFIFDRIQWSNAFTLLSRNPSYACSLPSIHREYVENNLINGTFLILKQDEYQVHLVNCGIKDAQVVIDLEILSPLTPLSTLQFQDGNNDDDSANNNFFQDGKTTLLQHLSLDFYPLIELYHGFVAVYIFLFVIWISVVFGLRYEVYSKDLLNSDTITTALLILLKTGSLYIGASFLMLYGESGAIDASFSLFQSIFGKFANVLILMKLVFDTFQTLKRSGEEVDSPLKYQLICAAVLTVFYTLCMMLQGFCDGYNVLSISYQTNCYAYEMIGNVLHDGLLILLFFSVVSKINYLKQKELRGVWKDNTQKIYVVLHTLKSLCSSYILYITVYVSFFVLRVFRQSWTLWLYSLTTETSLISMVIVICYINSPIVSSGLYVSVESFIKKSESNIPNSNNSDIVDASTTANTRNNGNTAPISSAI